MNISRNLKISVAVATVLLLVAFALFPISLSSSNPASNTFTDSGVAACKNMAENAKKSNEGTNDAKMTEEKRNELRAPFESSKHADLKSAGVDFVEAVYKVQALQDRETDTENASLEELGEQLGEGLGAVVLLNTQYGLLKTACANHGVELPSLGP